MRPIRTALADPSATTFESLGKLLSSHRAVTRVSLAALSFTIIVALGQQAAPVIQAGPEQAPLVPESLLPQSVGVAIASGDAVNIPFESVMDPASVEAAVQVLPAHMVELDWNDDHTELSIAPERLWRTDERYLVVVAGSAATADGAAIETARRYAFTTQTAPTVSDFQVHLAPSATPEPAPETSEVVAESSRAGEADATAAAAGSQPPTRTATEVSATSAITVSFSEAMDVADVEEQFSIAPKVEGDLTWSDGDLVFTPTGRLEPGARYTISVIGAHDRVGNLIGGKANFSFIVQAGAQLTKTQPEADASDVEPATVEMWFSRPMDIDATNEAFALKNSATGALVGGLLNWNEAATQLIYTPDAPFAGSTTFEVSLGDGARDADGNAVATTWTFATKAAPVVASTRSATTTRSATVVPPAAPATSLAGYALNQVNAARAAYGFAPVVLDASISAVASAHAWDQASNGYFSHYGLNGSTRESRLRAGGVSFSWSGENQCYHVGMSEQATLDWCHAQFMAEPYPGHWNHIGNILNPNARRMGIGIATVSGRTVITWNFTD
ncbi:MAG TPA: Ig-like domain-containing protein [Candidatus Limnocylindria bacterium]